MFNGDPIREERKAAGLSQEKLAELAGTSAETISRMENGRAPTPVLLNEVADVLVGQEGRGNLISRCFHDVKKNWAEAAGVSLWEAANRAVTRLLTKGNFSYQTELLARAEIQLAKGDKVREATGYMHLGNLWKDRGGLDNAMHFYTAALARVTKKSNRELWERIYTNHVTAKADAGAWPEVEIPAELLATTAISAQDRGYAGVALGKARRLGGDFSGALDAFGGARREFETLDDPTSHVGWAELWIARTRSDSNAKNTPAALKALRNLVTEHPDDPEIQAWALTFVYELSGDTEAGERAYRLAVENRLLMLQRKLVDFDRRNEKAGKPYVGFVVKALVLAGTPLGATALWVLSAIAKSSN